MFLFVHTKDAIIFIMIDSPIDCVSCKLSITYRGSKTFVFVRINTNEAPSILNVAEYQKHLHIALTYI